MVGLKGSLDYVSLLSQINHWNCFAGVYPEVHQNIRGLLVSLFLPSCINAATGFSTGLTLDQVSLIALICSGFVLIPLLYIIWKYRKVSIHSPEFNLTFVSLIIASILASPYSNLQELTQLALAAGLIWQAIHQRPAIFPAWFNFNGLIILAIALGFIVAVQNLLVIKFFVLFLLALFFYLVYRLARFKEIPTHDSNSL